MNRLELGWLPTFSFHRISEQFYKTRRVSTSSRKILVQLQMTLANCHERRPVDRFPSFDGTCERPLSHRSAATHLQHPQKEKVPSAVQNQRTGHTLRQRATLIGRSGTEQPWP